MADRLQAYADWLVANQDKRGTTEYETVANAYKQMRQQPVDRSYSSAFQQSLDAPLENMATTARMLGAEGTADTLEWPHNGSRKLRKRSQSLHKPTTRRLHGRRFCAWLFASSCC